MTYMMLIINHYTLETDIDRDSYFWTLLLNLPKHLLTYIVETDNENLRQAEMFE